jgi:hypothetical protein
VAITPINYSRVSPPVDSVGDKHLERSRREFLDLIKSDERRHDGDTRRGNREQQSQSQQATAQEAGRQSLDGGANGRSRPVLVPANNTPAQPARLPGGARAGTTASNPGVRAGDAQPAPSAQNAGPELRISPAARAMLQGQVAPVTRRDQEARDGGSQQSLPTRPAAASAATPQSVSRSSGAASPARQPNPIGPPLPPEALPRWPAPPPGSSLVAAATEARSLNLVAEAPTAAPAFRLSSEVPREVADRIAHFMRTGSLDRTPFNFGQVAPVVDGGERVPTPEEAADQAVASLLSEAAPHMRLSAGLGAAGSRNLAVSSLGNKLVTALSPEAPLPGHLAAQAAIQAQAGLQPPMLVAPVAARSPGFVPAQPRASTPTLAALPGHLDRSRHDQVQNGLLRTGQARSGDVNPLFAPAPFTAVNEDEYADDHVIDLIAGPRQDTRRDRIA